MRLAFAGTPDFARRALARLHAAGHDIVLVLTQPDRPAGRGMKLQPSPVKQFALENGLPLAQPQGLRLDGRHAADAAAARLALLAAAPQAIVVAAYGLILPAWLLDLPPFGCINIHASLLPRWRGAAPIQRAIEAGDATTGVTIMQMDAGLDTGAMLLATGLPIAADDTAATLHDRLALLGGDLIVEALQRIGAGALPAKPQPTAGVTYAAKIDKAEAVVDWTAPAKLIERRLRAFDPFPGCVTACDGQALKLWRGRLVTRPEGPGRPRAARPAGGNDDCGTDPAAQQGEGGLPKHPDPAASGAGVVRQAAAEGRDEAIPGTVLGIEPDGLRVACGEGELVVTEFQRAGGTRLAGALFLARHAIGVGTILGSTAAPGQGTTVEAPRAPNSVESPVDPP